MIQQNEFGIPDQFVEPKDSEQSAPATAAAGKKVFVEPEISAPVDVLEATTFFMSATSGATP